MSITEKMFMGYKKDMLILACKDAGLLTDGTKSVLAKRLSDRHDENFSKTWKHIANDDKGKELS